MRLLGYIFMIIALFFSVGCEEESFIQIDLGEIELEESSKIMMPYSEEVKILMFRDSTGDALRLVGGTLGKIVNGRNIVVCNPESFNCDETFRISYTTVDYSVAFTGSRRSEPEQRISIDLSLEVELQQEALDAPNDYPFFDVFRANYRGWTWFGGQIVVDDRGRTDIEIHDDYKRFREEEEIFLLGERFENVLVLSDINNNEWLYYSKEKGIVGLVDENRMLWGLDN